MSSIRNVSAGELGDNMQWEMRWLPSYFYKDDDEDEAEWEMRWLPPYFYKDDNELAFEEEGVITIGLEPIVTPSSYMTFEQICLAARLTSAIKGYHLEKANKEKEKEEKEQKEASFQFIVKKKKKRRVRKCGVSSKKMRR